MIENMVYLQLRRRTPEIYYFAEKNECDFIVFEQGKLSGLYQVCLQLDQNNLDRELSGLFEAMDFFNKNEGVIITRDQSDTFTKVDKTIKAIPFYQWATKKNDDRKPMTADG